MIVENSCERSVTSPYIILTESHQNKMNDNDALRNTPNALRGTPAASLRGVRLWRTTRQSYLHSLLRATPPQAESGIILPSNCLSVESAGAGRLSAVSEVVGKKTKRFVRDNFKLRRSSVLVIWVWNFGIV